MIFKNCKVDKRDGIFIGQKDKSNQPNGFVRIVYQSGEIYEGTVLND